MDNNIKQEVKTPISIMLDMAKNEVERYTFTCMQNNRIPPELMIYVLKDILLDVYQMKAEKIAEDFVEMQRVISGNKNKDNVQED